MMAAMNGRDEPFSPHEYGATEYRTLNSVSNSSLDVGEAGDNYPANVYVKELGDRSADPRQQVKLADDKSANPIYHNLTHIQNQLTPNISNRGAHIKIRGFQAGLRQIEARPDYQKKTKSEESAEINQRRMYSFKQLYYICTCISENTTTGSRLDQAEKFVADLKDEVATLKEADSYIK